VAFPDFSFTCIEHEWDSYAAMESGKKDSEGSISMKPDESIEYRN